MRKTSVAAFVIFAAMLCAPGAFAGHDQTVLTRDQDGIRDCTRLVASGNPDYPPYLWRSDDGEDHLVGAAADLLRRIGTEIGVEIDVVDAGNWGRVQQSMREGTIDLIAGAFFTLPRLEYMDYFHPAFWGTRTLIWTRDDVDLDYVQWSDLRGLEGLTVINNSFGQKFDSYAKSNLTIREVPSLEQGLRMLSRDRASYLIYEEFPGKAMVAREKIDNLRSYDVPVSSEELYFTMSHKSACNTGAFRGKFSEALFRILATDEMTGMVEDAIARWKRNTN